MDNLPPSTFQFSGEDYGPVDFPSTLPADLQAGMAFAGGGPVFPQNQRGSSYGMPPFHMNYSQQASMPSMSSLPSSSFRSRFSEFPTDQSPHLPMPIPSPASGMMADRLPSFSTIVSSSGGSELSKSSQALYSSIATSLSAQQHAFQPSSRSSHSSHFDAGSFQDQVTSKSYSKSSPLGSTSPGMSSSSNFNNNIPHSSVMQGGSSHSGSNHHLPSLSPRSYKVEDVTSISQQAYLSGAMNLERHTAFPHNSLSGSQGQESMTLPKFKHKYLSHTQLAPRRPIGTFKFFLLGKTERQTVFNKGTQTREEPMGELKIKIPKTEVFRSDSDSDGAEDEMERARRQQQQLQQQQGQQAVPKMRGKGSPRITFPYDAMPPGPSNRNYPEYSKNSKLKTVISPSFMDSTGKATMTTCVANKATIVTVGIVSRPANLGSAELTHSSPRDIMATGNGYPEQHYPPQPLTSTPAGSMDRSFGEHIDLDSSAENYDQIMEERKAKARDLEQERMEVSVRIDDTQYVNVGNVKRWQCNECEKSYTTKHNLVMHVLDHSGIKPHLCLKCGKYFKQLSHLNTHMLTHDHIKPHTCQMCGKGFTQISHLKRHMSVSEKNGYCANLRSKSSSGQSPSSATKSEPGQVMPQLPQTSVKQHRPDSNQGLMMPSQPQPQQQLQQQQQPPLPPQQPQPVVGSGYMEGVDDQDMKDDKGQLNVGPLACRYCDRRFKYPSQLKDHMHTHNGHRPYMCTECGMDFMKEHHLKAHQFTHTGLKPYSCETCGRSFNQRANLQRHKLIHQSNRSFKCTMCDKTFTQPQTLKAHMVVHADRKPYECTICGKEFGRYHNLQGHMHIHTNSKPYVCFCGSTFTLKGNLNRHKKVKHGLNETTDVMEEDAVNFLSSLSERARDDHPGDGEGNSEGEDDGEEKYEQQRSKGRKSIPRKITQGEGEEGGFPEADVPPGGVNIPADQNQQQQPKPFVIPNPDTDDEEEDNNHHHSSENHHHQQHHHHHHHQQRNGLATATTQPAMVAPPVPSGMMSFQPLNTAQAVEEAAVNKEMQQAGSGSASTPYQHHHHRRRGGYQAEDGSGGGGVEQSDPKRPRRQSQRKSPKVQPDGGVVAAGHSDEDGDLGEMDIEDDDWVPGAKRRSKSKAEDRKVIN